MFNRIDWKARALAAETALAATQGAIIQAEQALAIVQQTLESRATLIAMVKDGAINRFTFVRNGEYVQIETYSTMGESFDEWKNKLLPNG